MRKWTDANRLVLVSFLGLFLEVALIRWIPGSVRLMGYYANLVLISSFLGMGGGLLIARDTRRRYFLFAPLVAVLVLICHFSPQLVTNRLFALASLLALAVVGALAVRAVAVRRRVLLIGAVAGMAVVVLLLIEPIRSAGGVRGWLSEGYMAWGGKGGLTASWLFMVPAIFLLNAAIFVCIGQLIGRELAKFTPLLGYSLNILGSLLGVLAFGLCSWLGTSPLFWFAVSFALSIFFLLEHRTYAIASAALLSGCLIVIAWPQGTSAELWSPYYRIEVDPYPEGRQPFSLTVNHSFHQAAHDLSAESTQPGREVLRRRWDLPYEIARPQKVLILGSGTGNDVAAAVRAGVPEIHAVEIDPIIIDLGERFHPEDPYHQKQVRVHATDARAYLRNTQEKYDLIAFGTLDSHTLFSGMGNIRLDSYVYTRQSIEEAREHLTERGIITLTFSVGRPWIETKLYELVRLAFDREPLVFYPEGEESGTEHKVFVGGSEKALSALRAPRAEPFQLTPDVTTPTDDWPHLYIKKKSLSNQYVSVILLLSVFSILLTRLMVRESTSFDRTFFMLGAGFLLLETKSITYLALLFGSTWVVNCVVFSAILLTALLSNLAVHLIQPKRVDAAFAALTLTVIAILALAPSRMLVADSTIRTLLAVIFVGLPVFFSGFAFATLFARVSDPTSALGSNLIGAVIGGFLEYGSLLFGSRLIYLLALVIYLAAWWSARRPSRGAVASE